MPWLLKEIELGRQMGEEFEKLGRTLKSWPQGRSESTRGTDPAQSILRSIQTINATFAEGQRSGAVTPAQFGVIGREFESIGRTISGLAGGSSSSSGRGTP